MEDNQTPSKETDSERAVRHIMTGGFLRASLDGAVVSLTSSPKKIPENRKEPTLAGLGRKVRFTGIINSILHRAEFSGCPIHIEFWENNRFFGEQLYNDQGDRIIGHAVTVPQPTGGAPLIETSTPEGREMMDEWLRLAYQIGQLRTGYINASIGILGVDKNQKLEPATEISFWITNITLDSKFEAWTSSNNDNIYDPDGGRGGPFPTTLE